MLVIPETKESHNKNSFQEEKEILDQILSRNIFSEDDAKN
jgi:hypothetical protein